MDVIIVVLAYNRKESLARCLYALSHSVKPEGIKKIDLYVSIDLFDNYIQNDLAAIGDKLKWPHGKKKLIKHKTNIGLREHVLQSGDFVKNYDGLIMLEDDIYVSPYYLNFVFSALSRYGQESCVAGISLYTPQINEMAELPFTPVAGESDVFMIKSAQSWGQCWNNRMWGDFKNWYYCNQVLNNEYDMPQNIYNWPSTSWKKFFNKYLVETDRYFLYSYVSYSTNCSDVGVHNNISSSRFQVPLELSSKALRLSAIKELTRYDSFWELELWISGVRVIVDTYSSRRLVKGGSYLLSLRDHDLEVVDEYTSTFRPVIYGYVLSIKGSGLKLFYCTDDYLISKVNYKDHSKSYLSYFINTHWKYSLVHGLVGLRSYIKSKVSGFFPL